MVNLSFQEYFMGTKRNNGSKEIRKAEED